MRSSSRANNGSHRSIVIFVFQNDVLVFTRETCLRRLRSTLRANRSPCSIHQISTLEKTKSYQHSILSSLMSVRFQRVALFCDAAKFASSEEIDFHVWFTRTFCAIEASTSGVLSLHRETKFIIGFDFAVTFFI